MREAPPRVRQEDSDARSPPPSCEADVGMEGGQVGEMGERRDRILLAVDQKRWNRAARGARTLSTW